jgi:hypothetical protein
VAEVAEQPPEPLGPTARPVGDDTNAVPDPGAAGGLCEIPGGRQRVPSCAGD